MSKEWFNWYVGQASKQKKWLMYRERFLCPCCYMPSLESRANYEICVICFWEDDGQDTDDADIVRGGPNADYSLKEARENFEQHHTMYRLADESAYKRELKKMPIKKEMYCAFTEAIDSHLDEDWAKALKIEDEYHKHC